MEDFEHSLTNARGRFQLAPQKTVMMIRQVDTDVPIELPDYQRYREAGANRYLIQILNENPE
ncbi:hypothetical protein [Ewingella americana]|uniref:hypothetical protein n=1 Tax=Ewingella americana TaxID=41202 RepID=UPI0012ADC174|nr:hypothetical protein [Ewingella americana]MRT05948.1 hypothetical protein [Ewingella americana]